jgi:hypothetical protein
MIIHDNHFEMRIVGWKKGAQKVSATNTIRSYIDLELSDAKSVVDRSLGGEQIGFILDTSEKAMQFSDDMDSTGFVTEVSELHSRQVLKMTSIRFGENGLALDSTEHTQ